MSPYNDYFELAMLLCGFDPENEEQAAEFEYNGESKLYEKYGIDGEQFEELCAELMKYAAAGKSPITGKVYQGFALSDCWLVKREIKQ